MTERKGQNNLAFASLLQLGDPKPCVDLLVKTHRAPEAAMFARTYAPSKVPDAVDAWRAELKTKGRTKLAAAVAHPGENPELFEEGWEGALARERGEAPPPPPEPLVNGTAGEWTISVGWLPDARISRDTMNRSGGRGATGGVKCSSFCGFVAWVWVASCTADYTKNRGGLVHGRLV